MAVGVCLSLAGGEAMSEFGAAAVMPPKKQPSKPGRPAEPKPLRSLVSLKGTADFEEWLDRLVDHSHQGTRTLLLKNALRVFAQHEDFKEPQPKR
jgi:hypothetical protein